LQRRVFPGQTTGLRRRLHFLPLGPDHRLLCPFRSVSLPRGAGRAPALTCRESRPRAQRPGNGQRRPPVTRSGLYHACPASEARLCATPRSARSLPPEALGHRRLKPLNHMRASNLLSDG